MSLKILKFFSFYGSTLVPVIVTGKDFGDVDRHLGHTCARESSSFLLLHLKGLYDLNVLC